MKERIANIPIPRMSDKHKEQTFLFGIDAIECARYFLNQSLKPEDSGRYLRRLKSLARDLQSEYKKQFGKKGE
tara:strand:- start:280 stop:498 length:219 start_codon:yes stop_codon:yes gene_type:complete